MSLLYNLIEFAACLPTFIFFFLLTEKLFSRSARFRYPILAVDGIVIILLGFKGDAILPNSIVSLLIMLAELCLVLYLYSVRILQAVLTVLLFNVWDIVTTNLVIHGFLLLPGESADELFMSGTPSRILYLISIYLLESACLYFFLKIYRNILPLKGKALWISVAFFFSDFLMILLVHLMITGGPHVPAFVVNYCFILTLLMLFTTITGLVLLELQQAEQLKLQEQELLKLQLADQQQTILKMRKSYDSIRTVRHDLKNILLNYRILLNEGHIDRVQENINDLLDGNDGLSDLIFTDNHLLNGILQEKHKDCLSNSIVLQCHVVLSALYEDLELMVMISNLLDNAIEAECREPADKRKIIFELIDQNNKISIVVQNFISESVLKNNPKLQSNKKGNEFHGLGIKSIRTVLDKRNGLIQIYEEGNMFCVHIIVPELHK